MRILKYLIYFRVIGINKNIEQLGVNNMVIASYVSTIRSDNNEIAGYTIKDKGNTKEIKLESLKQAIKQGKIRVTGLELTGSGDLISTEEKYKKLVLRLKLFGLPITEIPTYCGHKCYLISNNDQDYTIYIPSDVTRLNEDFDTLTFTNHIEDLQGTLRIVGGQGLIDTNSMFSGCEAQTLDLSNFDTSNVTNMEHMFWRCKAQNLDLSNLNTSNTTTMQGMFIGCEAQTLDLSNFDTSNVTNMEGMFGWCLAQNINLSSFDTSNVTTMNSMFSWCLAQNINLSSFDTSNVTTMDSMFKNCKAQTIDISNFSTDKIMTVEGIFKKCQAQVKATDGRILEEYFFGGTADA